MSQAVKGFTVVLASLFVTIGLLAVVLLWFGTDLAKLAIAAALNDAQLPPLDFRVDAVGPTGIQLSQIRNESGEISAERLEAHWTLSPQWRGHFDALTVEGLSLQGQLRQGRIAIAGLEPWLTSPASEDGSPGPPPFDRLDVRGASLRLETPGGPQNLDFDTQIELTPTLGGVGTAVWRAPSQGEADLAFELASDRFEAHAQFEANRSALVAWLPTDAGGGAPSQLRGTLRASARLPNPATIDAPPVLAGGQLEFALDAEELALGETAITALHVAGDAEFAGDTLRFETRDARIQPATGEAWDLSLAGTGRVLGDTVEIETFRASLPALPLLGRAGRVAAEGAGRGTAKRSEGRFALDVALDATPDSPAIGIRGPIEAVWTPDALELALPACLGVALDAGPFVPGFVLEAPAELCVTTRGKTRLRVPLPLTTPPGLEADLAIDTASLAVRSDARRNPLRMHGRDLEIALDIRHSPRGPHGTIALAGTRLGLPRSGLRIEDPRIDGQWELEEPRVAGRFRAGRLIDPTRFDPLRGNIDFEMTPERIDFDARMRDETDSLRARTRGHHGIATGRGRAHVEFEPLRFGAPHLTLAAIERWLGPAILIEAGQAKLAARVGWDPKTWQTQAGLDFDGIELASTGSSVRGLSGTLALVELTPAATAEPQSLRFAGAEAGLPIGAGRLVYTLGPGRVVDIVDSEFALAGGQVKIRGTLDLAGGPNQRLDIAMVGVALPELLAHVPVEGLDATGRLSGEVQLTVVDGRPVLRGGVIRALEGGHIRYRPGGTVPSPAGPSDPAAMVRQVMSDFRYEAMNVSLAGWLDESASMQVQIRGHNPTFQEGHPVNLTLNLSTAFAEAVSALPKLRALFERLADSSTSGSPPRK